jgi:hypothetical protein
LKVKELQNVLQLSEQATGKPIEDLKEVKDAIGEWHDWEELRAIATRLLDHPSCRLTKTLKATCDSKFNHAVRLSQRLSATYRRPHARGAVGDQQEVVALSLFSRLPQQLRSNAAPTLTRL